MSLDRFLLAFESRDLSQADKSIIRMSSFPNWVMSSGTSFSVPQAWGLNFPKNKFSQSSCRISTSRSCGRTIWRRKISHRTFRGCESNSQIGSDRKLRKSQISISKQMYHTVTLLMEIINISGLDFYFGESTRAFISPRTRVKKPSAAPRGLQAFRHHLN